MKIYLSVSVLRRIAFFVLPLGYLAIANLLPASEPTGTTQSLALHLSKNGQEMAVTVPASVSLVTIQCFVPRTGWENFAKTATQTGVMKFKLPRSQAGSKWRAIGWSNVAPPAVRKFPNLFYQGAHTFGPIAPQAAPMAVSFQQSFLTSFSSNASDSLVPRSINTPFIDHPVEADIWRTDGDTVYFFNQLRGLQILDLSKPSDPRLTASLRLPYVGQDMYLLPASGTSRSLVLLSQSWVVGIGQQTRINVVKVSGTRIEITHIQNVTGYLTDSRMFGNRLVLATHEWSDSEGRRSCRCRLSEWMITPGAAPLAAGETLVDGQSPIIAAGSDWLALAVVKDASARMSVVSIFAVRPAGLTKMAGPIKTEGQVETKFGIHWSDNVLTTISESNGKGNWWAAPVTVLENFRAMAPEVSPARTVASDLLGRLELARGEGLFATRFAGKKAYAVTFLRTDPLWVIDLSDAANPIIAGHLEVPGWSTFLQPMGDLLFSIGFESGTVAASLFDVADPAAPTLLRRLNLGSPGSFSEATWDEKALRVLPDASLAMIPLSKHNDGLRSDVSSIQLVDIDVKARDLRLRGKINHAFNARRADLLKNAVVSISQRVLTTADISDRDSPRILSEVSLVWTVDRAIPAGGHLLQIEDGNYFEPAALRVSSATATEAILAEIPLGIGTVRGADFRAGKLYILREVPRTYEGQAGLPMISTAFSEAQLALDVYDASALPSLALLGTCATPLKFGMQLAENKLFWPQPTRPAVVISPLSYSYAFWGWGGDIANDAISIFQMPITSSVVSFASISNMSIDPAPYFQAQKAPSLITFDTSVATAPVAHVAVSLGADGLSTSGVIRAADGLMVIGISQNAALPTQGYLSYFETRPMVCVIDVGSNRSPNIRPLIDLPGELFAITELDARGFLAMTRRAGLQNSTRLEVSACNGFNAFLIAGFTENGYPIAAAAGRRLFVARPTGLQIFRLSNKGKWLTHSLIDVGWQPSALHWAENVLIAANADSICATDANGNSLQKWQLPTASAALDRSTLDAAGALLIPFGPYGVERLER